MPQRAKGARLYLRERKGRPPVYVIRDGEVEIGTGCGPNDVEGANRALAEHLARTFRPDTRQRDLAAISIAEVLMLYGRDIAPERASAATIGYHIKALLPFWGDKSLADVKGSTCRDYGRARAVSGSTVRRELKTMQAAINHWHRESPLAAVPRVTMPPEGARRERYLTRQEAAKMLWACRRLKAPHVARFILIGLYTGTRHAAVLDLGWEPSLTGGHIDVERGVMFRRGSAERETSKRRPPVQLPQQLRCSVARWRKMDGGKVRRVVHYRGRPIAKMKRAWASVVKEAGLGRDVTPHVLRHTCATWLLWSGKTIWDVAGVIGADASTVERVYGHHRPLEAGANLGHKGGIA